MPSSKPQSPLTINITGDRYTINIEGRNGSPMVVFSHGFGVKCDSRGLFTDIASSLPTHFGYILFDYNKIENLSGREHVHLRSYSEQVQILGSVLGIAKGKSSTVYLVGHSMGSVTISLLKDADVHKVILLAPPLSTTSGRRYFSEYPGAHRDNNNILNHPHFI